MTKRVTKVVILFGMTTPDPAAGSSPDPPRIFYAHSLPGRPPEEWETLEQHMQNVAIGDEVTPGAGDNASYFSAREMGEMAGWLHDLGKASTAFQDHIKRTKAEPVDSALAEQFPDDNAGGQTVDHSTAGARVADSMGGLGRLLSYAIAGHHAGLPDWTTKGRGNLRHRLTEKYIDPTDARVLACVTQFGRLRSPRIKPSDGSGAFSASMLSRMVFSSLVDADYLWTERFYSDGAGGRISKQFDPAAFTDKLDKHLRQLRTDGAVNSIRREVLKACRNAAEDRKGFFSLHVPTGGGKTLASMAFALRHAAVHGLRRVVYAIPLTTIIEQTSNEFRKIFGNSEVLEHHSAIDPEDQLKSTPAQRLASENYSAPLIVTTNVQLLESLFAARPSRCRKLHHLAGSVIVFDEVQMLPVGLLHPTLAVLTELVQNYGCSIVLCSATQPAIQFRESFPIGLKAVRPIISDPATLHQQLKRNRVRMAGRLENEELVQRLASHHQVLCIVNTRRHAADLAADLPQTIHLSANLCAAHREQIVAEIRRRLSQGEQCRVVSTTVMEAGVDVDFPVVYRAEAGLDSIAQAAGRCNREGKRSSGDVWVFEYDRNTYRAIDMVSDGIAMFRQIADRYQEDLLSPQAIDHYFRLLFWDRGGEDGKGWDHGLGGMSVMECLDGDDRRRQLAFQFATAAQRYRLIQSTQTPIVVPFERGEKLIKSLLRMPPEKLSASWIRDWDRKSQRFSVGIYEFDHRKLLDNTTVMECHGRWVLCNPRAYDLTLGLRRDAIGMSPELLIP
ncbi:hypothetical protein CKO51_09835 [Rhodopirellula sp. SM50]|nr:hypothetical protein CKO51_09835 [Rhodopirellula sp. SM50]